MDEEKKWEERTQVGPYQLEEQLPQDPGSPGELYLATHEESGATAVVLKPAAGEDAAPIPDFRVELIASQAKDYLALEVKDSRRARAPDKHSADALMPLLGDVREGVGRMTRALDGPEEPRPLWRLGLAWASVAAVAALLFALVRLVSGSPPPGGPESLASTPPAAESYDVQADTAGTPDDPFDEGWLTDAQDAGNEIPISRPLPSEPLKGQKRPPCARYVEAELIGACWIILKLEAPCPESPRYVYENEGKCYAPILSAKPPPQALEP
ncbi:hypothetical protein [Archangium sp.]|uniref:hypothetical protein n=1 Tax=Archangium sp. TaxID=1872627 RepID=UPI00389A7EB7